MKFTIIMPTYNDALSISETLYSVINQTYKNWELLISDDGSTDNTKEIVESFIKKNREERIRYFYKNNSDQLNAILAVMDKINGDFVYILHSDDLFADNKVLEKMSEIISRHSHFDAFMAKSSLIIDENSKVTGKQKFLKYRNSKKILPLEELWLGRNLFWDFAFFKVDIFKSKVKNNYLIWNTPFWCNYEEVPSLLKVKTVNMDFIKYRVFEGNYINSEIGKLNVINGELRTVSMLLKFYYLPMYKLQYFIFRGFNKLGLIGFYYLFGPFYFNKESHNKGEIIEYVIKKRYKSDYKNYMFLNSIINFYKNIDKKRTIYIDKIDNDEIIYKGSDMRIFNNNMINGNLSPLYKMILEEMNIGFNEIVTKREYEKKVTDLMKFLCLYPHVRIIIRES